MSGGEAVYRKARNGAGLSGCHVQVIMSGMVTCPVLNVPECESEGVSFRRDREEYRSTVGCCEMCERVRHCRHATPTQPLKLGMDNRVTTFQESEMK